MKTKFIGLDGFGEIEAVSKKKTTKKTKNLSTAQKSCEKARQSTEHYPGQTVRPEQTRAHDLRLSYGEP